MSNIRRTMMAAGRGDGGGLPEGYTELPYIVNPSSAYIDTGVVMNNVGSINIVIQASNSTFFACGSNGANGNLTFFIMHSLQQWTTRPTQSFAIGDGNKHDISLANGVVTCDGVTRTFAGGNITDPQSVLLFAARSSYGSTSLDSRRLVGLMYYAEIKDSNGDIVFKGIPAKDVNNAVGLFDLVTMSFFTSASNVEFVEN